MDLPLYLQGLSFRFVHPERKRLPIARWAGTISRWGAPLDGFNTRLPFDRSGMRQKLRGTRIGSAGSTLAVRAILNRGVAHLAPREAFVAFGMGHGDTLLAAVTGNREKRCIGILDQAAKAVGDHFLRRFEQLANDEHHFVEASFADCLSRLEEWPIGFCFVSADSHEPVARRLADCEPHLAENAYLLLDNGNCERTRQAAFEFMAASPNQYRVLIEARAAETCSLTWGRGVIVIQLLGRNAIARPASGRETPPVLAPAA